MSVLESVTGYEAAINGYRPGETLHINGRPTPSCLALFDPDSNRGSPVNSSSTNGQAALNGLTRSSGYINGHSIDEAAVNGQAGSNVSAQTGKCTNGHLIEGELVNGQTGSTGSTQSGEHPNGRSLNGETVDGVQSHIQPPIAICGMALRLPAGLRTPQQLWEFLLAGGDARGRVPDHRYNVAAFHDPTGKHGTVATEYGYFLDDDIGALDTSFFSMPRLEVERTDPQQRLMLEVARECFEDAGETAWRGKRVGCYMGSLGEDWCEMFARETQNWGPYRYTGFGDFALSNRVSYEMDLQGPRFVYACNVLLLDSDYSSMTTRTACSSSLVALHEACVAISRGDCDSAIVGGANLIMAPGATISMTEQTVLSKDGSCNTFSADANGYARGEAITAIYIKRLDDALRDGNPIRAVIKGTATNHDGKTPGMTVPSSNSQQALMRRAYEVAGTTDFSKTGFVECHGTGTPVGDPIETTAVGRVFGDSGVYIGSIKPNFGHTEGASGLLSVIKVVLALENSTIPPNIKFLRPNPAIPFESAKLTVPIEPTPWPQGRLERASVNSFGVGGTNAHAVIDSAASFNVSTVTKRAPDKPQLLLFSANSQKALTTMVNNYRDFVEREPKDIGDIAYTLANKRQHLSHRTFAIASKGGIGTTSPVTKSAKPPTVIMVFTGQGAQWPRMGRDLMDSDPTFLNSIQRLDGYLQGVHEHAPEWKIEEELRKTGKKSRVHAAEFSQPLCTAIQIALVDTLAALGIYPDAVVGHSSGEIAGAYAAGALTAKDAIINAVHRGATTTLQKRPGAMVAIGMSWEETEKYLIADVVIACDNSPKSVTISGDVDKVEAVITDIHKSQPDVMIRKLQVDKAYHSYHMAEFGAHYQSLLGNMMNEKEPTKLFFSSVTGGLLDKSTTLSSRYWQRNLESPVLFRAAVSCILQHPIGKNPVFLEIGPHSALAGPLRQILTQETNSAPYTSTLIRNRNCVESLLSTAGKLYTLQVPIDLNALIPTGSCLSNLPLYPWDHEESYWYESRLSKDYRLREYPHHDLLGVRIVESTDIEPSWRNLFHLSNAPWVRDHKVGDDIVFPFAGYIAMAGEAVRQVTRINETFQLRHVIVSMALVVPDGKPIEMITTFRPHRLTDTLDSKWWEFTIASHNGHTWTKHCVGEAMAQTESLGSFQSPEALPRKIGMRKWFDTLRRAGLDLGPAFRNLVDVSVGTTTQQATGEVLNNEHAEANKYHIYPALIDAALQLMGIAFTNGEARKFKNRLPTSCDNFSVSRCSSNLIVGATTKFAASSVVGEARGIADGITVLSISGLKLSAVDNLDSTEASDTHAAARQEWGFDIDFIDIKDLIKPSIDRSLYTSSLETLGYLCMVHSQRRLAELTAERSHLHRFHQWIDDQLKSLDISSLSDLDNETLSERIDCLVHSLAETPASSAAAALQKVSVSIGAIFSGHVSSWEDILSETIADLYEFINNCDISLFIQGLAHCKPNLRVLEIGSWRSSPSSSILKNLTLPNGRALCSKYTFVSKGFISAEETQLKFPNMEYATLDINDDPLEQGFKGHQYDLVIASNAIHETRSIGVSLRNIRKLLHPAGRLLLQELCPSSKWINYIFGTHPRWWCGIEDGRLDEPYADTRRWQNELIAAGYENTETVILDSAEPSQLNAVMIVKPSTEHSLTRRVSLLCRDTTMDPGPILQELEMQGYEIIRCSIHDPPPPNQDVIALLDRDEPFFENIESTIFDSFKTFLHNLDNSGVFWVTRLSQMHCQDPRFAQVIGTARTVRSELLIDFATCEVDNIDSSAAQVVRLFAKFEKRDITDLLEPDFEYSIYDGVVNVGRFYPFALSDDLLTSEPSDRAMLEISVPGRLSTLYWAGKPALPQLQPDGLEVEVYAAGLNFRDVLVAMNIVHLPQGIVLGLEGAGIVRQIGSQVKTVRVGDRVAIVDNHMFSTTITTSELLCAKIPDDLSFIEASTMFFPYMTAMHSLMDVGGLEKGQSVLIHSACGGVGLAAIQLAQMIEAEIYVTVGSQEKVEHLMKIFNIPRNRIFNSRDDSFMEGVMRETERNGVDIVLNSLSGELLHASWECVAPFGKMVEIGKRDLLGFGKLNMNAFLANRSYCCVDADALRQKPFMMKRLFNLILEHLEKGRISPIHPVEIFDVASPYDAFRYMQPGQHIGRICIPIRKSPESADFNATILDPPKTLKLSDSASYLLVGGLGGLGRAISTWMVEHGARHLVYLSRNAGLGPGDELFVHELNSMGCQVQLIQGSVTNAADVTRAIEGATRPLRGILQMSMVLRDEAFSKMTLEQWNAASVPKVGGTWNLHNATVSAGLDLDFFVLFSSLSGIIGQPGQANYASGNTFLDAFVQYRTNLGLPASAIDIGAVAEVGYISQNPELMQKMAATGFKALKEQEVLDALVVAMTRKNIGENKRRNHGPRFVDSNSFALGLGSTVPLDSPVNRAIWRKDRRMGIYHNTAGGHVDTAASSASLKAHIASVKADISILKTADAAAFFANEIGKRLFALLLKPEEDLNASLSLVDLGMDSLVGIELRAWWKQVFGFDISVLEMLGMGTLKALGQHAAQGLMQAALADGPGNNGA
ncbi:MAG: hypothetical protein Q9187_002068 [Circinaria calcarea]